MSDPRLDVDRAKLDVDAMVRYLLRDTENVHPNTKEDVAHFVKIKTKRIADLEAQWQRTNANYERVSKEHANALARVGSLEETIRRKNIAIARMQGYETTSADAESG